MEAASLVRAKRKTLYITIRYRIFAAAPSAAFVQALAAVKVQQFPVKRAAGSVLRFTVRADGLSSLCTRRAVPRFAPFQPMSDSFSSRHAALIAAGKLQADAG